MDLSKPARAGLVALMIAASVAAADPPERSIWNAALSLDAEPSAAVAEGDAIADWLHGLAFGFEMDEDSAAFASKVHESAFELDLARVYDMLPDQSGDEHRSFLHGRSRGRSGYTLRILGEQPPLSEGVLGDLDGGLALTPSSFQDRDAFSVWQGFDLSTGSLDDRDVTRTAGALLRELEHAAVHAPPGSDPGDAVLEAIQTALPATWAYLDPFIEIDRVGGLSTSGLFAVEGVLRVDLPALSAELPALGRYLDRMDDVLEGTITVGDSAGRKLVVFEARSDDAVVAVRFLTTDGALVPFSDSGSHPADRIPLGEATELDLVITIDGVLRHQGTKVTVSHWPIPMHYEVTSQGASAVGYIGKPQSFDMKGESAFTALLVSAAESTFQLDHHADALFSGIASGADGAGSRLEIGIQRRGQHHALHESVDTVLVDNALIRFGARVLGGVLLPDDDATADFVRLEHAFLGHLAADWSRARASLLAASESAP